MRDLLRELLFESFHAKLISAFLLGIICCIFGFLFQSTLMGEDLEQRFKSFAYDLRLVFGSEPESTSPGIILVEIDDASLNYYAKLKGKKSLPRSPLDREMLADIINSVSSFDPALIVLDVLLDRLGEQRKDQKLISELKNSGRTVLLDDYKYPILDQFKAASKSYGNLEWKADSAGNVQMIRSNYSERNRNSLIQEIRKLINPELNNSNNPNWLRINYLRGSKLPGSYYSANELDGLPLKAKQKFKKAIILVGTAFGDLYQDYQIPYYSQINSRLSEIELLSRVIEMELAQRRLATLPNIYQYILLFLFLILGGAFSLSLGFFKTTVLALFNIFIWCFTGFNLFAFADFEIALITPSLTIGIYYFLILTYLSFYDELNKLETEKNLEKIKRELITNHLNRHNIFNDLSTLRSLISRDKEQAREYLEEFSELFRTSLLMGNEKASLNEQLEYLASCLKKEKVYYGNLVNFEILIDDDLKKANFPWNIFYPLVENAIKYSRPLWENNLNSSIKVEFYRDKNRLIFKCQNSFNAELRVTSSTKMGLKSLNKLLSYFYKEDYQLESIPDIKKNIWTASVSLPIDDK